MARHEIWMEGAIFPDGGWPAYRLGEAEGETFREAVDNWFKAHPSRMYDDRHPAWMGCPLYPTHEEAAKKVG